SATQEAQSGQALLLAEVENQRELSSRLVRRYTKYRRNIRRAMTFTKEEIQTLRSKRQNQESIISDLRRNLSESTAYITEQSKENKSQISNLTDAYETQIRNLKGELEMLYEQNKLLGQRSQDFEKLVNEKVKLENDLIIADRKREESEIHNAAELSNIQKALVRHRNDAKDLAIELEFKNKSLDEQTALVETLAEEKQNLNEQVETLQLLWRDQQTQVERLNDQKNSLQKLNQELSISINEYRREVRELKERLDASELRSIAYKNEVDKKEKMRASLSTPTASAPETEVKREDTLTPEIISKIDKALSSLHAGH
ncbi:MAG: hypothetical protein KDD38_06710, partial [Bdellovibrionales bacterium]|nr:hypothetical protein [Bdellovibrionales bacterium]